MKQEKKSAAYVLRLGLTLLAITAVVAALLGAVNYITKDKIAQLNLEKSNAAKAEVLSAQRYDAVEFTDDTGLVQAVWSADGQGYVVQCVVSGSQGDIDLMVGVDAEGAVTGVSIVSMSETSGLGDNAKKDEWRAQFTGATGSVAVSKDGGQIEALTGATVTSRAVCNAINAALQCVGGLEQEVHG